MNRLRRPRVRLGVFLLCVIVLASRFVSVEQGSPIAEGKGTFVWVFDHGYHAGLVLPRAALESHGTTMSQTWLAQFPEADWFEFGWGDSGFYYEVPTFSDVTFSIGAKALLVPSDSVLHVVAGRGFPWVVFNNSDRIALELGASALARVLAFIESAAATEEPLGPGLYGDSAFFQGWGRYHAFQTCNSWVSQALRAGGIASSPALSVLSSGLLRDLKWRYGE